MQTHIQPLSRVATWLSVLTALCLAALPMSVLWAVVMPDAWLANRLSHYPNTPQPAAFSFPSLLGLGLVDLITLALIALILWRVSRLLLLYRRGLVLRAENARHILQIGQGLVTLAAFKVLAQTLDVLAITWGNPPGMRQLQVGFSSAQVSLLLAGGLMILIGWAMQQAAAMADDHAAII